MQPLAPGADLCDRREALRRPPRLTLSAPRRCACGGADRDCTVTVPRSFSAPRSKEFWSSSLYFCRKQEATACTPLHAHLCGSPKRFPPQRAERASKSPAASGGGRGRAADDRKFKAQKLKTRGSSSEVELLIAGPVNQEGPLGQSCRMFLWHSEA